MVFPIHEVERRSELRRETLGSKPKFWFLRGSEEWLFKGNGGRAGEDWAEVVACHLCRLIGLPHVEYGLAVECEVGDRKIENSLASSASTWRLRHER